MIQQFHFWAYIQIKLQFKKTYVPVCSQYHYLQLPRHGNNLNAHQQMNGLRRCSTYTQGNTLSHKKKTGNNALCSNMDETKDSHTK